MALTIKEIDSAKPKGKPYKLTDGGGLCLLIAPSGGKLWRYRYYFAGKEKMLALGEYPLVTLKEARERHLAARKTRAASIDPMAERKAGVEAKEKDAEARQREAENSFESIARKWWEWWSVGKSPRHADTVMRRLEADVFPAFGHKFIDAVTAADARELMLAIERRDARDVAKRTSDSSRSNGQAGAVAGRDRRHLGKRQAAAIPQSRGAAGRPAGWGRGQDYCDNLFIAETPG